MLVHLPYVHQNMQKEIIESTWKLKEKKMFKVKLSLVVNTAVICKNNYFDKKKYNIPCCALPWSLVNQLVVINKDQATVTVVIISMKK